ncbi:MAG: NAD(P)/FAD-dependent oxidoreductase [Rickettsiales bacterium]|jgi:thioredoxin reductase (NADPH)|nr:NAD(P)/FAD-dependent oxidoreductase [Rickettsiales bacterium]
MEVKKTDIIIIGAGPIGLFAIFEAGMLGMNCHVFDSLEFVGGQCSALYPEKPIYDIAGFPSIKSQDLINNLEKQAAPFNPTYHLEEQVISVTKVDDHFVVKSSSGTICEAKAIFISAGCGSFGPNRPPLANLESYEASGSVKYMVNKIESYRDKKVVIAGGGDSALDWVINLEPVASKVYLVHRRDKFRAQDELEKQMRNLVAEKRVELVVPYQLDSLKGDDGQLSHVVVKTLAGDVREIEADVLLPFYGLAMELGPIADWGLNIDKKHIAVDPATMQTNIEGIYALGDIADYQNKKKLMVVGFSECAFAAHDVYHRVFPNKVLHFEYSTTKGVS